MSTSKMNVCIKRIKEWVLFQGNSILFKKIRKKNLVKEINGEKNGGVNAILNEKYARLKICTIF